MSQNTEKMKDAKMIWEWAKTLIALRESDNLSIQLVSLMKKCKDNLPSDFTTNEYCFLSKISEEFANQCIDFEISRGENFKFEDLLNVIRKNTY